jgi:N-acyl homoserine lactone hydrolase
MRRYSLGRMLEIKRLHLASLSGSDIPVHGFVVRGGDRAVLVDTGVGGPPALLEDWRVVNRSVADALADIDMSPADIELVINTHLHFDHCGQNAVFSHAPVYVQRAELERSRREEPDLYEWFGFMNAEFELLDGDAELMPGLSVLSTPGHTAGHQCVVVSDASDASDASGADVLIGDAAYAPELYLDPSLESSGAAPGQAADPVLWRSSLERVRALGPSRVHFCHSTDIVHG